METNVELTNRSIVVFSDNYNKMPSLFLVRILFPCFFIFVSL